MTDFQRYQAEFTAHIRNPKSNAAPAGVDDARMAIYREIVLNNLSGVISACYPVCQEILGQNTWDQLVRQFFSSQACTSPFFRDIPKAFLDFVTKHSLLSAPLSQLAHYEWAELAVSNMETIQVVLSATPNLMDEQPILTSAHMLLSYEYSVHEMSKHHPATIIQNTYLLMFRNQAFEVKFVSLNALTFELLHLIKAHNISGRQALIMIAEAIQHPEPESIVTFGIQTLQDLMHQGAILGSKPLVAT